MADDEQATKQEQEQASVEVIEAAPAEHEQQQAEAPPAPKQQQHPKPSAGAASLPPAEAPRGSGRKHGGKYLVLNAAISWRVGDLSERRAYRGAVVDDLSAAAIDTLLAQGDVTPYDGRDHEQQQLIADARARAGLAEGGGD